MLACILPDRIDVETARRLLRVAPVVERDGDVVFLDVRGTSRLHGGSRGVFEAIREALGEEHVLGMALASNRFTAEVAARHGRRPVFVPPGEEALFLSRLPLSVLELPDALARRLAPLGLQTLGDFASLPVGSVERRYGPSGVALHRLARGQDEKGLVPERHDRRPEVLHDLPGAISALPALMPALEDAAEQLGRLLEERGQGVVRLSATLFLDVGGPVQVEFSPAAPETRGALLADLLRLRLEQQPPGRPVEGFLLAALDVQPLAVHQNALFGEVARDAARRAEALSRLRATLGERVVRQPRPRRDHRLEQRWIDEPGASEGEAVSARPQKPAQSPAPAAMSSPTVPTPKALRLLETPEPLVPILASGRLVAFRRGREQWPVARLSRPRRLEGGWWERRPWARDEYDLVTTSGAHYRVCHDLHERRWLLVAEVD